MQRSCRHLLVDEFQDLTPAHVLLLRLLALPELDVFGVGDDDQCIYGHAGADPAFLIDYDTLFPGAGQHALHVNYRCPVAVVDAASTLLGYNLRRIPKSIVAGPTNDDADGALARPRARAGRQRRVRWPRRCRAGSPTRRWNRRRSPCSLASTRCCSPRTSACTPPACRSPRC